MPSPRRMRGDGVTAASTSGSRAAGREHAGRLASRLASVECDAVYSSPRVRALETAEAIAAALGRAVVADDGLRELDFGELEGRTYDEIAASEPDLYRAWMTTPTTGPLPGRRELRRSEGARGRGARADSPAARERDRRHPRGRAPRGRCCVALDAGRGDLPARPALLRRHDRRLARRRSARPIAEWRLT